jgi:predicted nucleotidyltransferase
MLDRLAGVAGRLVGVDGVVAVSLGGSRARGTHRPDSDWDVGVYYRDRLDVDGLRAAASEAGFAGELTEPGGWGPWVNGGGWLTYRGEHVDWIYRDIDRVGRIVADCRAGRYEIGVQAGHPLGFYSHVYAGEVALCQVLADPTGSLAALRDELPDYPVRLAEALVRGAWEAEFLVQVAAKGDASYVAGCLFRAVGVLAHAMHGKARRWLLNEKGMVESAGRLPGAPEDFTGRVNRLLGAVGTARDETRETLAAARALVTEIVARL